MEAAPICTMYIQFSLGLSLSKFKKKIDSFVYVLLYLPSMKVANCAGRGRKVTWRRVGTVGIGETGESFGGGEGNLEKYPLSHYTTSQHLKCPLLLTEATSLSMKYFRPTALWTGAEDRPLPHSQPDLLLAPRFLFLSTCF